MDFRSSLAISTAKTIKFLNRRFGTGGTAAPGLAALYLDQNFLRKLSDKLDTTLLITGTNGKTTTSRIVGNFLEYSNIDYIHNRHGSNLERGLISAFIDKTDFTGKLKSKIGVFETDEAALRKIITKTSPKVLTITNLFRDQLDRYGEVDTIKKMWLEVVSNLDESVTLVLNADDPTAAFLGKEAKCKVLYFGVEDKIVDLEKQPSAVDSIRCPVCFSELVYSAYYLSHQGVYKCNQCSFKRPKVDIAAKQIKLGKEESEFILLDGDNLDLHLTAKLPGLYNIYNCLAAYSTLKAAEFEMDVFPIILNEFKPVFGRNEKLVVDGRNIVVALAKNPTGFNEIIRTFLNQKSQTVLIAINDRIADGRDVSWLWDVDFEVLTESQTRFFTSGVRSADTALRLKYAGIKNINDINSLKNAFDNALASIPQNDTLIVIPTYTAMLELKKIFTEKSISGHFWED